MRADPDARHLISTTEELRPLLKPSTHRRLFNTMDADHSGRVDFLEFRDFCLEEAVAALHTGPAHTATVTYEHQVLWPRLGEAVCDALTLFVNRKLGVMSLQVRGQGQGQGQGQDTGGNKAGESTEVGSMAGQASANREEEQQQQKEVEDAATPLARPFPPGTLNFNKLALPRPD